MPRKIEFDEEQASDTAAASAAYLVNVWPELAKLTACELYKRLVDHFHTAIMVYADFRDGMQFVPEPSPN